MKKQVFNPFLPLDEYIPNGEPHIFGDRVYLYGSHDYEGGRTFCMGDYTVYSAPVGDLSDWRCEGVIYSAKQDPDYSEKRPYMYAPDVVQGNDGRYYLYYCLSGGYGFGGYFGPIAVAVCDTPAGKYEYLGYIHYSDGTPMKKYVCFDPCAFNDNGIIRIYYGTQYMNESNSILAEDKEKLAEVMKRYNKTAEEILGTPDNVNGACMVVLEDDMLTVKEDAKHIIPYDADFGGHEFFEASSMRKVGEKYYFIFSSQKNHELCYAISDYPDRNFVYGGTIVSNGDVGMDGVDDVHRMNMTGTTHGSIIKINNQWYVFYHRLTHKSDYSRQACAEKIYISADGRIEQVEITSCGLNDGALKAKGRYPAVIACCITNGSMPHGSNRIFDTSFPNVNHRNGERFIAEISGETLVIYRYFSGKPKKIGISYRGAGEGTVEINGIPYRISRAESWTDIAVSARNLGEKFDVTLEFSISGNIEMKELFFE